MGVGSSPMLWPADYSRNCFAIYPWQSFPCVEDNGVRRRHEEHWLLKPRTSNFRSKRQMEELMEKDYSRQGRWLNTLRQCTYWDVDLNNIPCQWQQLKRKWGDRLTSNSTLQVL